MGHLANTLASSHPRENVKSHFFFLWKSGRLAAFTVPCKLVNKYQKAKTFEDSKSNGLFAQRTPKQTLFKNT